MRSIPQSVRGMNDILPAQTPLWRHFEDTVRDWLAAYGYQNIRLPIVEATELFVRSIGVATDIVEKEMYTFIDAKNGDSLTLRPEGTASCVRAVLQHNLLYQAPQRLYYMGPMFRHERPQKGRYRQFHQLGVEALGYAGPDIDVEHIVMTRRLWNLLGLSDVRLQINSLGSYETRAKYREKIVEFFSKHADQLDSEAKARLEKNPLRLLDSKDPKLQTLIQDAPKLLEHMDEASLAHFSELQQLLSSLGIPFEINPNLVRGLDYYNLTVFEWVTDKLGAQGTICAGGRYDGLVDLMGGKSAPACGYAIGIERVLTLCQQEIAPESPDAYLVHAGLGAEQQAFQVAEVLRDHGFTVILHVGGGGFKAQMKKADQSGARFAILIGEEELNHQKWAVKTLRAQTEQQYLTTAEIIELLRTHHA